MDIFYAVKNVPINAFPQWIMSFVYIELIFTASFQ